MQMRAFSSATLSEQAQRQLATHWRVRISQTLSALEAEVRRMLRVESGLEKFATDMASRLAAQRAQAQQLPHEQAVALGIPSAPFEWVAQGIGAARSAEIKQRYHQLARELHPDFAGADNHQPRMSDVNAAYALNDLPALVRLEAQALAPDSTQPAAVFEDFVRQVELATGTYRRAYTQLLNSPLYSLYARASGAREDGWDFIESLARRVSRALDAEKPTV